MKCLRELEDNANSLLVAWWKRSARVPRLSNTLVGRRAFSASCFCTSILCIGCRKAESSRLIHSLIPPVARPSDHRIPTHPLIKKKPLALAATNGLCRQSSLEWVVGPIRPFVVVLNLGFPKIRGPNREPKIAKNRRALIMRTPRDRTSTLRNSHRASPFQGAL